MRALILQHEPGAPAGILLERLVERGANVVVHQVMQPGSTYNGEPFPDPTEFDVVVPLGSVHGVYDEALIGSWVHREVAMIAAAHAADVPIFGICFGAQVITTAFGGRVEKASEPEIGWYYYDTEAPDVVPSGPWFTWHFDRCVLPDGVDAIASSPLCPQAFRVGRTMAVQFHPEVTKELVAEWIAGCPTGYFADLGLVADEILAGFSEHGDLAAKQAGELFDWFLDRVVG